MGPGDRQVQARGRLDALVEQMERHGYRGLGPIGEVLEQKYREEMRQRQGDFENLKKTLQQSVIPTRDSYTDRSGIRPFYFVDGTEGVDDTSIGASGQQDFEVTADDGFNLFIERMEVEVFSQQADEDLRVDVQIDGQPIFGLRDIRPNAFTPNKEKNFELYVDESRTLRIRVRNTSTVAAHDVKVVLWGKRVTDGSEDKAR